MNKNKTPLGWVDCFASRFHVWNYENPHRQPLTRLKSVPFQSSILPMRLEGIRCPTTTEICYIILKLEVLS